MSKIVS